MTSRSDRLVLIFSSIGHWLMHMLTGVFFVIVLALETEWQSPYHELIELWTLGALLVGLCALPAGWLADRWSAPGMMIIMFLGMGVSCLLCANADNPKSMLICLALLGASASIYHPVGVPWIVRNAKRGGKALGINGIFGGFGLASAGGVTGLLIDWLGWQAAFLIPGIVSIVSGLVLLGCWWKGQIQEKHAVLDKAVGLGRRDMFRGLSILMFTMFSLGFVYQASQVALPKLFDLRLHQWVGEGTSGIGLIVSAVYALGSLMQLFGGYLADHFPLKRVYLGSLSLQAPVLLLVAVATGPFLVASATLAVVLSAAALPAENLLLARYSPPRRQSLVFGLKFVLALGTTPLAISFVSHIHDATGRLMLLYVGLSVAAALAFAVALALPGEKNKLP